jgi:hypothetical protein
MSRSGKRPELRRRDFVRASLAAGAGLAASAGAWKAWSQAGQPPTPMPTIPVECVPPVPFGQAAGFGDAGGPVRVRKSVFELDANEISRLKAAYAALLKLTRNNDPRSWYAQGAVHCWYCSGAVDGLNGMEIHGSWWFLAWHRAYLHFHERILGSLIEDPTFALPYWDWDSCHDDPKDMTGRNRFPGEVYGFPTDQAINPLSDTTRAAGPNDRIPTGVVGPTAMKPILNAQSFADFGGSSDEGLPVFASPEVRSRPGCWRPGRTAWCISGPRTRRVFRAWPTWACSRPPDSIPCSLPTTPILTGCGACGPGRRAMPVPPTIAGSTSSRSISTTRRRPGR